MADLPRATLERVPLVVVVTRPLVVPEGSVPRTSSGGRAGSISHLLPDLSRFDPIEPVGTAPADVYLLVDVQRGGEHLDQPPAVALPAIMASGRTPLTVDEGISFVTQWPTSLAKNHCFSLAGSRCGDRRVPAIWLSKRAPLLGWCWEGAPHTWLGTASAAARLAA